MRCIGLRIFYFMSQVRLTISDLRGLEILGESLGNSTKCIEGGENLDYVYRIRSTEVGALNLTVVGEVDSTYPQECGPEFIIHKRCILQENNFCVTDPLNFRDVVSKTLLVEPEGFPVEIVKSALLCSNGQYFKNLSNLK